MRRASSLEKPWCRERLRAGEGVAEGGMAGQPHWLGANSRKQWRTEELGVLLSTGLQSGMWLMTEQQSLLTDGTLRPLQTLCCPSWGMGRVVKPVWTRVQSCSCPPAPLRPAGSSTPSGWGWVLVVTLAPSSALSCLLQGCRAAGSLRAAAWTPASHCF